MMDELKTEAILDLIRKTEIPLRVSGIGVTLKETETDLGCSESKAKRILSEMDGYVKVQMRTDINTRLFVWLPEEFAKENYPDWIVED